MNPVVLRISGKCRDLVEFSRLAQGGLHQSPEIEEFSEGEYEAKFTIESIRNNAYVIALPEEAGCFALPLAAMNIDISPDSTELGRRAGTLAIQRLQQALANGQPAVLVLATGLSQRATLETLVQATDVPWERVEVFHLDEYVGIPPEHGASFRRYLSEQFVTKVGKLAAFHGVRGDAPDPQAECQRLTKLLNGRSVDVGLIGIGENAHLAFNDPPADFTTKDTYHVVALDEACRLQQVGEGWYPSLAAVPTTAISMTVPAMMSFKTIICSVPDTRKAAAVQAALEGPLTPNCPASILRQHADCNLLLDQAAASLLKKTLKG
jgi:glucosamine-6-phosphate deaminase